MIKFAVVRWKNFLSTGNHFTEIRLNEQKMTLIVGENGAGKSQLLDAITFALFGRPFRKINKPTLVNSITQKQCLVEIEFEVNGQFYKVVRGLKPARFEIFQNDRLINQTAAIKDYQELLEKQILKTTFKSFTQIVILGSATFTPFMRLSAADRRDVLDDLLDIQIFSSMNVIAKQRMAELKTEFATIDNKIAMQKDKLRFIKKQIEELKKNSDDYKQKIIDEIERNEQLQRNIEENIFHYKTQMDTILSEIMNETITLSKINELTQIHTKINSRRRTLEKQINFYNENDHCDQCHQDIDTTFKIKIIDKNQQEIDKLVDGASELVSKLDDLRTIVKEIDDKKAHYNELDTNYQVAISKLDDLSLSRKKYDNELNSMDKDGMSSLLKQNIDDLHIAEGEFKKIITRKTGIVEERDIIEIALQVLKDGGIKSQIIKQYLPIINQTINRYLNAMDFMVDFYLDENFTETIKSRYRDEFSYDNFSEGEKARIDLALLLTWRLVARLRNSVHTNLLIMDETMDSSMDTAGVETLLGLLTGEMKGTNLFIISHRESMVDSFDKTIKVHKEGNFSVYEAI